MRNQFAGRLASEYAPVVLVSFGSGTARVQVLVTAQDGAAAYRQELRADLRARQAGGARLLGNSGITYSAQARAALAAGQVDARLQMTLAAMARFQHLQILAFRGAGPGASPGVPLRTAELSIPAGAGRPRLPAVGAGPAARPARPPSCLEHDDREAGQRQDRPARWIRRTEPVRATARRLARDARAEVTT